MLTDQTSFRYIDQEDMEKSLFNPVTDASQPLRWVQIKKDNHLIKLLKLNAERLAKAVVQDTKRMEKDILRNKKIFGG
jgi:hypothetical protein